MLHRLRTGRGTRALAAVSGVALAASSLSLLTSAPAQAADPVSIQIIGTNDFHGRLLSGRDIPGAAKYAGAIEQFRSENPNTIFAAAGDLIGATTFESFINQDKPTIDILNAMDLDVSAVGNHELDQGYADLVDRVMAPFDATANPYGGAEWEYIAANIEEPGGADEIAPSWTVDVAGVTVGFVGAVTEDLDTLVRPEGIVGLETTDIVEATNAEAAELKTAGADVVVLLVHEGAPGTDCSKMATDGSSFAPIINDVSGDVDAIMSGHTHLNYDCSFPVADWADRPVTERPVVSAGQYGAFLNRLSFTVDPDTGAVLAVDNENVDVYNGTFADDPAIAAIVAEAEAEAEVLGAEPLGKIAGPFRLARLADGSVSRGGESTQGNLVAEVQRWATSAVETGSAQLAVINPGGLREDLLGLNEAGYPATLTYQQAATSQPFANTLVNMQMTGAQIKMMLEQQWQPEDAPRPFLKLGTSHGFNYIYDPAADAGERVLGMWLNGDPIDADQSYSVTANSFLAGGGDNFEVFKEVTARKDTGKTDLQAMVDYLAEFGTDEAPLAVDYDQHAVGISGSLVGAPGGSMSFEVSSFSFTNEDDVKDESVTVSLGDTDLGSFPLDNTVSSEPNDETGSASVTVELPSSLTRGLHLLTLTGEQTGTEVRVPIRVAKASSTTNAKVTPKKIVAKKTKAKVKVTVKTDGAKASGKVRVRAAGKTYTATLKNGKATVKLKPFKKAGKQTVTVRYLGDDSMKPSSTKVTIKVAKAKKGKKK